MKPNNTFYINITIGGQFAYGHYFEFVGMEKKDYKYRRKDEDRDEYIFINHSLESIAKSNKYDESINMRMINYRTNFGMLYNF